MSGLVSLPAYLCCGDFVLSSFQVVSLTFSAFSPLRSTELPAPPATVAPESPPPRRPDVDVDAN